MLHMEALKLIEADCGQNTDKVDQFYWAARHMAA